MWFRELLQQHTKCVDERRTTNDERRTTNDERRADERTPLSVR